MAEPYTPTEARLRERVKGSLGEYAHEFGIDGEAAMDAWIDQALAERDNRIRADERAKQPDLPCDRGCNVNDGPMEDCSQHGRNPRDLWGIIEDLNQRLAAERAKLQDRIEELEKNLSYEVEQKIKLADTLRDERAKRPDRGALPIIDPESWGWGHCISCGGGAVTHRGLMLLSVSGTPTLARIAWCEAEECIEDRKLTVALPVTPRHVEWIDSALSSLEGGRNV